MKVELVTEKFKFSFAKISFYADFWPQEYFLSVDILGLTIRHNVQLHRFLQADLVIHIFYSVQLPQTSSTNSSWQIIINGNIVSEQLIDLLFNRSFVNLSTIYAYFFPILLVFNLNFTKHHSWNNGIFYSKTISAFVDMLHYRKHL